MSHYDQVISDLQARLTEQEAAVRKTKITINDLLELQGKPALYADTDARSSFGLNGITPDKWYGQPLQTSVREYLEMRKAANQGAATVDDIFDALTRGGFQFEGKDNGVKKRGLSITLGKNPKAFHKLPNDTIGLTSWYSNLKPEKSTKQKDESSETAKAEAQSEEENDPVAANGG